MFISQQPHDFRKCLRSKCLNLTSQEVKERKTQTSERIFVRRVEDDPPSFYYMAYLIVSVVLGEVLLLFNEESLVSTWTSLKNVFIFDVKVDYSCYPYCLLIIPEAM